VRQAFLNSALCPKASHLAGILIGAPPQLLLAGFLDGEPDAILADLESVACPAPAAKCPPIQLGGVYGAPHLRRDNL